MPMRLLTVLHRALKPFVVPADMIDSSFVLRTGTGRHHENELVVRLQEDGRPYVLTIREGTP